MPDSGELPFAPPKGVHELEVLTHICQDSPIRRASIESSHNFTSSNSVYWSAEQLMAHPPDQCTLPPSEVLTTALNHLGLAFSPRTQRLATHTADRLPIEPLLALYCPVEGGDYIVDNTVRELGRRCKADVVVVDTMHLAAGQWGDYGPAGTLLKFNDNPLHLRPSRRSSGGCTCDICVPPSDEDVDVAFPTPLKDNPHSPRLFFDLLVNLSAPSAGDTENGRRPRIIYVRDHLLLESSLSSWWPALQSAVQMRRRSGKCRGSSVDPRTVIVVGATPLGATALTTSSDDSEEDAEREKDLRETWQKWCKGDGALLKKVSGLRVDTFTDFLTGDESGTISLRKTVLVPGTRTPKREADTRAARRREVNILTMRLVAGNLGASLPPECSLKGEGDKMWDEWSHRRFPWNVMHSVAERAIGSAELNALDNANYPEGDDDLSLLSLSWDDIRVEWSRQRALGELRKKYAENLEKISAAEDKKEDSNTKKDKIDEKDEIVENVRNADDLTSYERDLLACIVDPASMTVTFDDVCLPPQTVDAVRSLASLPLLHPDAFKEGILKQNAMKGSLLFGPPGVGKTHLVRALAKECGARMISVQPSNIVQMYMGEGEKCVRAVFSLARRLAPCVMFIDELDAMFPERSNHGSSASKAYRAIVTEFLQEMDGLLSKKDNVIIVGATNRPFDLDDAIIRRLPVRILVELPGEVERAAILRIHLQEETLDEDVDVQRLAKETDRFSGSDLKQLVIAAALDAVKESAALPWRLDKSEKATEPVTENDVFVSPAEPPEDAIDTSSARGFDESPKGQVVSEPELKPGSSPTVETAAVLKQPAARKRILRWRNFAQALTEIWPSASEHLGTNAKLKEWNDKFGGGGRRREGDDLQNPEANFDSVLAKVRRAFDLTENERALLKCAIDPAAITTTFADVHLPSRTVDAVRTIVSLPLLQPEAFASGILKEHGMRGSLLFGPPGTGKTHVVRALARESGAHMLAVKPSDILEMYVGQSEKLVRALFALARRLAPCIVFIDEIDSLFSQRSGDGAAGAKAHRAVLTEFMQEMDGLLSEGKNVIVIGATNRPFDLDDALLRRMPLRLLVDLPGEREREEILKILVRSETLGDDVDLGKIARDTPKFSGSDLKHLVVSAALDAVKETAKLPWKTESSSNATEVPIVGTDLSPPAEQAGGSSRTLYARHFTRALRNVQPSANEHTTTHARLREWSNKFGTGDDGRKSTATASSWSAPLTSGTTTTSTRAWDSAFTGSTSQSVSSTEGRYPMSGGERYSWLSSGQGSTLGSGYNPTTSSVKELNDKTEETTSAGEGGGASSTTAAGGLGTRSLDEVLRDIRERDKKRESGP